LDNKKSTAAVRRGHPKLWETVQDLTICSDLVTPLPGFSLRVKSLHQRVARLENNLFSVALFGAFSAGKSSLANALLGDSVLPVSPNPTTATINKILPPTDRYPHGTTKVKLKSLPDLTTDVLSSLAMFSLTATDLTQALLQIPSIDSQDVPLVAKPHLSFLRAVAQDQSSLIEHLGEELTVDYHHFRDFVVSEDKACFVEGIELYFSCPLTELGVVLVDTPGSNSTNVRHTNVAFDYIKNADAVLFVTYYNNPFCKADAQFLSQLGKVKDTFEMDKLFFLVNASDLAQTREELTLVLKHVENNLRTSDIIRPRLFPVSSQLALLAKLASEGNLQPEEEQLYRRRLKLSPQESLPETEKGLLDSGLKLFETSFYTFIEEELINLAVKSAKTEIQRILNSVEGLLEAAKSDASQRVVMLKGYRNLEQTILLGLEQISLLTEESSIAQEIDELIYYVNQRLSYRYSGLFDRNFFILMKPKEEQPKLAVQQCVGDFLQDIEVELVQEIRATSLRAERFVQKSLNLVLNKYEAFVSQSDQQCRLQNGHKMLSQEEPRLPVLSWDNNSLSKASDLYKNPKDWVEGQGRAKMQEMVIKMIQPKIKAWLNECRGTHKGFWHKLFEQECKKLKEQAYVEVSGYYSRLATALVDGYDVNYLEQVRAELARLAAKEPLVVT
jgi:GTPase SAR1 family protein